ncbi:MAG: 2-isopropylmalate synthase [Actinobacteria bacterium]|nr:2-isopropylmalate synthase [Actinomycetota bacterium]
MSASESNTVAGDAEPAAAGAAGAAPAAGSAPAGSARRNAGAPVVFFDTTLRDGEQSPGISLNMSEKLEIAHQLVRLGVDVIEAGFPATSPGDFEAVQAIAREVKGAVICGLARCVESDIRTCWDAIKDAERPRIHTFVSTSDIHLEHQIKKTRPEVIELTREMVDLAVSLCPSDVEFSAMDATRSDVDFLAEVLQVAIECGATTINVPDTVGYTLPTEFAALIDSLYEKTPGLADVVLAVHCHNDLGLAVANSLAAIEHGATQVEVAVNGLGERAGNAAIEEVAMALVTRRDQLDRPVNIVTTEIARTSRMVSNLTGYEVQPNKAIVGKNAFAHESGIHQDGVLKERTTFEIMHAKDIGLGDSDIVLGKHSGRHALKSRLAELGIHLTGEELDEAFRRFKDVADKKKQVTALDLEALATEEIRERQDVYSLTRFYVSAGSEIIPTSQVQVMHEGAAREGKAFSGGSVESVFRAIDDAVGITGKLLDYRVRSISSGKDALAEVRVVVEVAGKTYAGQAVSIDVLEASAKAYMRALNNVAQQREARGANPERVF